MLLEIQINLYIQLELVLKTRTEELELWKKKIRQNPTDEVQASLTRTLDDIDRINTKLNEVKDIITIIKINLDFEIDILTELKIKTKKTKDHSDNSYPDVRADILDEVKTSIDTQRKKQD
jgi:hypothetical protein